MVSTRIYLPYMARSNNTPAILTSTKSMVGRGRFLSTAIGNAAGELVDRTLCAELLRKNIRILLAIF